VFIVPGDLLKDSFPGSFHSRICNDLLSKASEDGVGSVRTRYSCKSVHVHPCPALIK
jgi:hypothetical protein